MPSLEVGTVGGGTILSAQASCLEVNQLLYQLYIPVILENLNMDDLFQQ